MFVHQLWQHNQHLNFGEITQVAEAAAKAASDKVFELTKAKIADAGVKTIDADTFERRELKFIGEGAIDFHVTVWGDTAPKVQIGVHANTAFEAQSAALAWARTYWWRDRRDIGIETVERMAA